MERRAKTLSAMIDLYYKGKNKDRQRDELKKYAIERLMKCKYGKKKPPCSKCPLHCYKPAARQLIRAVMRYSGPRMIFYHPVLAFRHLVDIVKENYEKNNRH